MAAGLGPLAVGTDGGGSIRIPATWSGVVGHKPTAGRVPTWPPSRWGALSHVGPLAWSVDDAALLLTVLARPDRRDPAALPPDGRDYRVGLEDGVAGLRIAYSPDLGLAEVAPDIATAVERAVRELERLGARVTTIKPPGIEAIVPVHPTLLHGDLRPVSRRAPPGAARPRRSLPSRGSRGGPEHHRGGLSRCPDDAPDDRGPDGGALRRPRSPRAAGLPRSASAGAGPARRAPRQGARPDVLGESHRPAGGERPLRAHAGRAAHRPPDRRAALRRRAGAAGGARLRVPQRHVFPARPCHDSHDRSGRHGSSSRTRNRRSEHEHYRWHVLASDL